MADDRDEAAIPEDLVPDEFVELTWQVTGTGSDEPLTSGVLRLRYTPEIEPKYLALGAAIRHIEQDESPADQPTRLSNRKIESAGDGKGLFTMANIPNHGNRRLGQLVSGRGTWDVTPDGGALSGQLAGATIGRIDLTPGDTAGPLQLMERLGPRGIQAMVAVTRLIWEKSGHDVDRAVTLRVSEVARAMGYEPDQNRALDPETLYAVGRQLKALTEIQTFAAVGPWDTTKRQYPTGWVGALLYILEVLVKRETPEGDLLPWEFRAVLGKNWAQAMLDFDYMQVAPGFLELDGDSEILLGWYYLTEFRYGMTKKSPTDTHKIAVICEKAGIDPGPTKNRGRFLERLHGWHERLTKHGVIGQFQRTPDIGSDATPGQVFASGEYRVTPPKDVLAAYRDERKRAQERKSRKRPTKQAADRDRLPLF